MENDRRQEAERIVSEMEKESFLSKVEELIKDNKITFEHEGKQYQIRLLNSGEKEELDQLRRKKFGQLIQDGDILLEKDLIKVLKEKRGIDLDQNIDDIKKLQAEELALQLKLGESISKNEGETILKNYKEQIEEIRIKIQILNAQRTLLLEFSLENQLLNYVAKIITYLSLYVMEDGTWIRAFKNLEEFDICSDDKLINLSGQYSMILQYI
jgi:hypothetical protein